MRTEQWRVVGSARQRLLKWHICIVSTTNETHCRLCALQQWTHCPAAVPQAIGYVSIGGQLSPDNNQANYPKINALLFRLIVLVYDLAGLCTVRNWKRWKFIEDLAAETTRPHLKEPF